MTPLPVCRFAPSFSSRAKRRRANPAALLRCGRLLLLAGAWLFAAPALAQTGPSFADDASVAVQTYQPGMAITTLTLPAATGGSGALSYTLTPVGSIPTGLSFSASARTVTGTPAAGAAVASLTYTVTDAGGNADTLPVTIVVRPEPTITLAATSVTNQPVNTYTAVLDAQPASDVTLTIRLAFNFVEPLPAGFEADQSSLVFTPSNWNTPQTVTLAFTQDIDPGAIFIHHDVSIGGRMTHTISAFYNVIIAPRIVVSPASLNINEGSSATYNVVWEFLQARATARTITVTPATSDATVATVSGTLTFIHGGSSENWDTPQMVTVSAVAVGDADTQGGTATISHTHMATSVISGVVTPLPSVAVSVVDSDSLRQLAVSVDDSTPDEGEEAVFTVALAGQAPVAMQPVTVDWAVSGAQAADYSVSGADTDGTLNFTGLGSQTLTLTITDDASSEGEETLTFTLSSASRADISTASATATIGESDRPITVSLGTPVGTALTEGTAHRFSLDFPEDVDTTAPVEVDWRISFPAASPTVDPADAADFTSATGTFSISAGSDTGNGFLTPFADSLNEAVESFTITVSNARGGGAIAAPSLSSSTMVSGTIAASDPVTVSIAGPTPPTAAEGGSAVFSISINNASEGAVSVPWSVNELSDAGIVGATSGTVTFAARTTTLSQNVAIPLAESETLDRLSPTETLTVTLGTVSGGRGTLTGSGATASVIVSFTGAARALTVTGPATIAETDSAVESRDYTIALSGQAFSANTAVTWTVTHGDTSDADFVAASDRSGTVTFGPDDGDGATRTFSITVAGDNQSESDETFTVQASVADDTADDGTEFGAAASTTITDDDSRDRVLTVTGPATIAENDDATNGVESGDYTVTLTGAAFPSDTAVTWTVTHGDTAAADFIAASDLSGMVTFGAADGDGATRTFSITVAGDQMNEGAERFSVQLSVADAAADGGTGYGDPAFTTIADDESDEIVVYVASSGVITEGGTGNPLRVRFRVDLNGQTASGDVVVSYTIVPGSSAFTVDDISLTSLTGMVTMDADAATPVTTAALDIDDTDDSLNEGTESFTVTATAAIGADTLRVINNSGTFTITANDFITAQLSSTTTLSEGASPAAAVTLNLDNTPTTEVTVDYAIGVDADAATVNAGAADYSVATGSATFAANTAPAAVTLLRVTDDELNEADEAFIVAIGDDQVRGAIEGSAQNQMSRGASQTYTISASDDITVSIAAPNPATAEEGGSAQFAVTLDGASAGSAAAVTVPYTVSGTTDTPTDANSGSIEIAAGQTAGAITLGIPFSQTLGDSSPAETLSVTLGAVSAGAGGGTVSAASSPNNAASVTVNYLSAAHTIAFTNPVTSIVEGGSATYTVTRSGPDIAGAAGIVLSWAYAAGTTNPASAADFAGSAVPAGGALTFTGDQTTRTFTIATAEDTLSEPGETFTLSLSAAPAVLGSEGGVALPAAITVTIGESDRPVTVAIAAPGSDLTEGTAANFAVSFPESVTTTAGVTVTYSISFPAASSSVNPAAAADFSAPLTGLTVTIPAGMASVNLALTAADDAIHEADEDFTVTLTGVSGGGAIAVPALAPANPASPGDPVRAATAKVGASDPVTVGIAAPGAAVREGGTAEFTVNLALTSGGATATSGAAICVMFGTAVSQQMTANTAGQGADIGVTDCAGTSQTVTPATGVASGGARIVAGQSSATLAIGARYDNYDEGATAETVTVTLSSAADEDANFTYPTVTVAASPNNAGSVDITNVNAARSVSVAGPSGTVAEDAGSLDFTVTVVGEPVTQSFQIPWTITAGSATVSGAGADIGSSTSGTVTVPISSNRMQELPISVTVVDDSADEGDETVMLALTDICASLTAAQCAFGGRPSGFESAPAVVVDTTAATATIGESDRAVLLEIAAPVGNLSEGTAANFTVRFAGSVTTTGAVEADWAISFPAASPPVVPAAAADFAAASGTVSIPAGMMSANLPITARADTLNEAAERFTVTLSNPSGGGAIAAPGLHATSSATADIAASDPITVSIAAPSMATVNEGDTARFPVTLSGASAGSAAAVTVTYTAAFTATSTGMFTDPGGGSIVIAASELSGTIELRIEPSTTLGDGDSDETIEVTLGAIAVAAGGGSATAASSPGNAARVTVNWITATHTIALSAANPTSVAEGAAAMFTVTRTASVDLVTPVAIAWAVSAAAGGNAADAADFGGAFPSGSVMFSGSETTQRFAVRPADDNLSEASESFAIALSATQQVRTSNGQIALGGPATVTITDDDEIRVMLSGPATVREETTAEYRVSLSAAPTGTPVTLSWTVAGMMVPGGAAAARAGDFAGGVFPTGSVSFAVGGALAQSITFTTSAGVAGPDGGTDNTPDRAFELSLSNIMGGAGTTDMTPPAPLAATIREDDPAARTVRMEQAATALNRATVALSVPVIARRLDPGRGLASPGLALNLGGQQLLAPSSGGASSASPGASGAATAAAGASGAVSTQSTASTMSTQSTQSTAAPTTAPGVTAPPAAATTPLDLSSLAQLAATQLQSLDPASPATDSRSLLQLLGSSGFSATSQSGGGSTLSVWGRGNYSSLEGEPLAGGTTYDYDGDSYGFYLGLDSRYDDYLAGVAVGYTVGDIELRAVSGPAAVGAEGDRSDFESDLVAVYPYAAWQPSERVSVWLLAGYGQGELEIEERRLGMTTRKATSDTDLWLGAAGLSWRRPTVSGLDVLLRVSGTALHGETDAVNFGDGTPPSPKMETDAQQLRGEAELGRVLDFEDGGRLRPYLRTGVSYDFGDGARDAATGELGTGFQLHWPRLGLETELEIQASLTNKGDRDYREYSGTGTLRYDLGGDRRGLQLSLRPSLGLARGVAAGLGASGVPLDGGAFGGTGTSALGGSGTGGSAGHGAGLGLRSELAYGIGGVRLARGLPGLLTLYGESGLASGASSYGGGLRFDAARFALDAGLRHESGADSDRALLLDATLRF